MLCWFDILPYDIKHEIWLQTKLESHAFLAFPIPNGFFEFCEDSLSNTIDASAQTIIFNDDEIQ